MAGRLDVLIVSPVFHGEAHGAAVYYPLLVRALSARGLAVGVISDRHEGDFDGPYVGLFPDRCGRGRRRVRDLVDYGIQNLSYLRLPGLLRRLDPRCCLVHSSFLNFPGTFPPTLKLLRRAARKGRGTLLAADVRDRLIPAQRIRHLAGLDAVVSCSGRVTRHLADHGLPEERITTIPVPQEPIDVDAVAADELLSELDLSSTPYIFYAGLIKEEKGVDLLLRAFLRHVRPRHPECVLVIAGLIKTFREEILRGLRQPGVRFVGKRSRQEVLRLLSRAAVSVNLSPNESLSRSSLEALALGRPALLPPNIPEFERHAPRFVADSRDEAVVGRQLLGLLVSGEVPDYPVEEHSLERLVPRYLDVLGLD